MQSKSVQHTEPAVAAAVAVASAETNGAVSTESKTPTQEAAMQSSDICRVPNSWHTANMFFTVCLTFVVCYFCVITVCQTFAVCYF